MEFINILNTATENGSLNVNMLKNIAYKRNFKFKYEDNNTNRIIFYYEKKLPSGDQVDFRRYCNGLICEYTDEWKIVCLPMFLFEYLPDQSILNDQTHTVFPVYDATIVNIYYSLLFEKWCFGTKRAFDISNQSWRGVTYTEILKPLVSSLDFNTLDRNITYIYAVTDPRVHLFAREESYNLIAQINYENYELSGIEMSVTDAINSIPNAIDHYKQTGEIILGYIFRSPEHSYIIESDLMLAIKKILYYPTIIRDNNGQRNMDVLKYTNDIDYITVRAYFKYYKQALELIPYFNARFLKIRQLIVQLIKYIISRLRDENIVNDNLYFCGFYDRHIIKLRNLIGRGSLFEKIRQYIFYDNDVIVTFYIILKNSDE